MRFFIALLLGASATSAFAASDTGMVSRAIPPANLLADDNVLSRVAVEQVKHTPHAAKPIEARHTPVRKAAPKPLPPTPKPPLPVAVSGSSLEAAVSSLADLQIDEDRELTCLAQAVYFEARGEPLKGQKAVADVVMNRTRTGRYPSSVCGVVFQKSQFENSHRWHVPRSSDPLWQRSKAVASLAMSRLWLVSESIISFHSTRINPRWNLRRLMTIGRHVFYG